MFETSPLILLNQQTVIYNVFWRFNVTITQIWYCSVIEVSFPLQDKHFFHAIIELIKLNRHYWAMTPDQPQFMSLVINYVSFQNHHQFLRDSLIPGSKFIITTFVCFMIAYTTWSFNLFARVLILYVVSWCVMSAYSYLCCFIFTYRIESLSMMFRQDLTVFIFNQDFAHVNVETILHFAYWFEFQLYWIYFILGSRWVKSSDMWRC